MSGVISPVEKSPGNGLSLSFIETIAGFTAGIVSTLAVHPFDIIKTRLQIDRISTAQAGSSFRIARDLIRNEGGLRAFYRGLGPNLVGNSTSWALYFLWYGNFKDLLQTYRGPESNLSALDYFMASGASGILTAICTNPIWVIKTRMLSTGPRAPGAYTSMAHGVSQIWRSEGLLGFYRGLLPSLFGVSHGAIQFMAYEQLKNYRSSGHLSISGRNGALSNWDYLILSALSKILAGSITYPYQVIRARLQTYDAGEAYKSASDVVTQIWKKEGLSGFYKGLGPNILRVLPSTCVTFLVYENTKYYLPRL